MKKNLLFLFLFLSTININAQYVDLGLLSGTLWKSSNEEGYYTQDEADMLYGGKLPSEHNFQELIDQCTWRWTGDGYRIIGKNGNSIFLPADGFYRKEDGIRGRHERLINVGSHGSYWGEDIKESQSGNGYLAVCLGFRKDSHSILYFPRNGARSIRLVKRF